MIETSTNSYALTTIETAELQRHEATIESGLTTFVSVGHSLLAIRDARLYRATHSTFEDYCRERWGLNQSRAYQLMDAAQVIESLKSSTMVELPTNEAQARPLAALKSPEERREVWQEVVELADGAGITAEQVRLAVARKITVRQGRSGQQVTPPLPPGTYNLILADPPWRYDFSNADRRAIEQHYSTMTLPELCALPVSGLAAPNCLLFCWATSPKLADAIELLNAWGFEYVTCAIWHKSGLGMGYYFRQDHELLLIGRRGQPGVPAPADRVSSVISAPKGRHSEKPEVVYSVLESMYPAASRLEMFARAPRPGWMSWGSEV